MAGIDPRSPRDASLSLSLAVQEAASHFARKKLSRVGYEEHGFQTHTVNVLASTVSELGCDLPSGCKESERQRPGALMTSCEMCALYSGKCGSLEKQISNKHMFS